MGADFTIRQGDTGPAFKKTVLDQSGNPIDLTAATVQFVMRNLSAAAPVVNAPMTVANASAGNVSYDWTASNTSIPGLYMAEIHVTSTVDGSTYTYPNEGYLSIEVEQNLTSPYQQLVTVDAVKDVLNMDPENRLHDTKILRWIAAARPLIEAITGPIIPQDFDEWYDGGQYWIMLRHTPSTALGTSPVLTLKFVSAYIGPIEYPFSLVNNPVVGSIYTAELDTFSRVVRRGPGGGIIPFPNMPQSVHIGYTAGQQVVPDNVYEATLEYLRENYQETAQALRKAGSKGAASIPTAPVGYAISYRVLAMLSPNKRAPSIF